MALIIEIDCPPLSNRPDYFYNLILNEIMLKNDLCRQWVLNVKKINPNTKLFGNWTWNLDIEDNIKSDVQSIFKEKLELYYNNKFIRYASW